MTQPRHEKKLQKSNLPIKCNKLIKNLSEVYLISYRGDIYFCKTRVMNRSHSFVSGHSYCYE